MPVTELPFKRLSLVVVLLLSAPWAVAEELVPGPASELVRGHCSACHSLSLVTAQRGDRVFWEKTIRWMQRTQNLWQIPAEQEAQILDYLAEHYDEAAWGRRPLLGPALLPSHRASATE